MESKSAAGAGHIMRNCSAGVVRPLSSLALPPSQAAGRSTASPSSAAATICNEPLMGNTFRVEGPAQAEDTLLSGVSTAMGGSEAGDNHQSQLPAGTRTRRTRMAAKTAIDAALQTLADVQVRDAHSRTEGCAPMPCPKGHLALCTNNLQMMTRLMR